MRVLLLFLIGLPACGGVQAERARVETLERRLSVLDEAFASQEQRIEQLKDRLALLEDRQETSQLQLAPKALPVVRLRPEAAPVAEAAPEAAVAPVAEVAELPADERPAVTITQADLDALGGGYEGEPGPRRFPRQPVQPPENAAFAGNIGVVPIAGTKPARPAGERAPAAGPDDDAIGAYKRAYNLYRAGDGPKAEVALKEFVARYADHDYADNALFWVGQIQFDESRHEAALGTFRRVVTDYPAGNKVPEALLMVGETQKRLGRVAEGRETQERVRTMYPHTEAGRKAAELLQPGSM